MTPAETVPADLLDIPEAADAWALHQRLTVVNALDSTRIAQGDDAYIGKLKRSGVTAVNHTVAATESPIEAIAHSAHPVVISHSGARALCDTVRNKTDEEVRALAANGGVIGVPPKSGFLKPDGLEQGSTIDDYLDHIDYLVELVGSDHVGVGTDVGDERKYTRERMAAFNRKYPEVAIIGPSLLTDRMHTQGLQSPGTLYNLTAGLLGRGYGEEQIAKIMGGNFMRVFRTVWSGEERKNT